MKVQVKDKTRLEISELAAQIIETEGVKDYLLAKKKASQRLGIDNSSHMPANFEIQQALIRYQTLFYGSEEKQLIKKNAEKCLRALQLLETFNPFLTGAYADDFPGINSDIELLLFLDEHEKLVSCLSSHKIPWQLKNAKLKLPQRQTQEYPCYQFFADDLLIKIICLPEHEIHTSFIDPISNKKMPKLNLEKSRLHLSNTFAV